MKIIWNKEEWKEVEWNKPAWSGSSLVNGKKPRIRKYPVIYYEEWEGGGLMGEYLVSNLQKFPKSITTAAAAESYFQGFSDNE